MVMIDDARGVWGHAPPGKFKKTRCSEIASEAMFQPKWSTCCYLLQPVKPLETTELPEMTVSHKYFSTWKGDTSFLEGLIYSLFGRLPSFAGMHHFTHVSPTPNFAHCSCAWMSDGKLTIQSLSL